MIGRKRVLIAPLDWGLGHATRCIPIIRELLSRGYEVLIAGEGTIKFLLQKEFPGIECLPLKGYDIEYARSKAWFLPRILMQIPKLLISIKKEKKWLEKIIEKNKIDIVISDNRFGLNNKKIYSIFITHQLFIKTPLMEEWLQKLNYRFINQFDECWIPDIQEKPNLAGKLSHPEKLPTIPIRYIGCLSRFTPTPALLEKHLLILLSGPEPQRSLLEKKLIAQLKNFSSPVLLVRGLPGNSDSIEMGPQITCINHLPAQVLQKAVIEASFVIARSGYSTIMDLMKLKKKSILIPTPGQTEQEYLAEHIMQQNFAFTIEQQNFDLQKALSAAQSFPYSFLPLNENVDLLKEALSFKHGFALSLV